MNDKKRQKPDDSEDSEAKIRRVSVDDDGGVHVAIRVWEIGVPKAGDYTISHLLPRFRSHQLTMVRALRHVNVGVCEASKTMLEELSWDGVLRVWQAGRVLL